MIDEMFLRQKKGLSKEGAKELSEKQVRGTIEKRSATKKYKRVPIRILTIGCPGTTGFTSTKDAKLEMEEAKDMERRRLKMEAEKDKTAKLSEEQKKFAPIFVDKFGAKSSKLQLEGVVTDIANVNKFVKKYDKSIYDIVGGPFQYDVKLSSGSIMDCYATKETVEKRIQ